ncbi:PEP-CTERM sorting domain-containing protein [Duganella sp. BJB488]|uniref:FxDxF family PEP-CTERM protein n=1 Tax=unclassified Duganella TaxID=2636909 RepID=UPI000E35655A|nr:MULTISPECIES: FxDxF family PEP-CTERM protein [unclassified Duganella]NVD73954.1 PEP-CTERM sorting domain-containing protein [Duganella sp. BJB1802]RFP12374.1 PEP-CTERM sorting domain-containing protein [Duganella sp. BJB489]RFP16532.1 PEP-CTERM sorting domain-containing protein [Duganella sp. BJB488]RFP30738.1 PEP-CTERM sorting domain-containing protein [Duganella sp. BJB480]
MKRIQTVMAALMLTGAAGLPLAHAADISQGVHTLDLSAGAAVLMHEFGAGNAGNTFSDRYNFTVDGGAALGALVGSLDQASLGLGGAGFDSFKLYNSAGLSLDGARQSAPGAAAEVWTLSARHLVPDSYYLLVSGTVRNAAAGNYVGSVAISAVPEPASYGMLLGGAGIVGWLARRRKA